MIDDEFTNFKVKLFFVVVVFFSIFFFLFLSIYYVLEWIDIRLLFLMNELLKKFTTWQNKLNI